MSKGSPLAYIGLTLHGVLFVALISVCAFDESAFAHDWADCLIPLGLVLVPFVLAAMGTLKGSSGMLTGAAVLGVLVGLLSILGPGLFVLVPSILYAITAVRAPSTQ